MPQPEQHAPKQGLAALDRHRQVMGHHAPLFYDEPIELDRGEDVWLYSTTGTRYLDLYNNVPCVGHANPRVAEAMYQQASSLNVHSRYLHDGVLDYAERLVDLHTDPIESIVIACSGSEATEMALRMARMVSGNHGLICTNATYHGNTSLVSKLTRLPTGTDRDGIRSLSNPQLFRPPGDGLTEAEIGQHYLDELAQLIDQLNADGLGVAGIMLCSILANEGLTNTPAGWFKQATDMVRAAGGVIIADEVQAGFARSGSMWGYDTSGFVPDIVCMGKPMGNGLPISGVAASNDIVSAFRERHRYFNTFAASPLQAAAGTAVLDEIQDRNLVAQSAEVGNALRTALRALQASDARMGDVRGHGLFLGIDWVHPGTTDPDIDGAAAMVERLKAAQMMVGRAGQHFNVIKIRPPLVFQHEHAKLFLDAFATALSDSADD